MHKISARHPADADINGSFNYTGPLAFVGSGIDSGRLYAATDAA
jgi:hypothetical protein